MAKLKGKGTIVQQTIATVLTDIAQLIDIDLSGEKSEDFDSTTLDGVVFKTKDVTGYSDGGTVKATMFFDPALAGHQALVALITTPASCVFKIKYSDSGPSSLTYTAAGFGLDQKVVMNDGVKATMTMNRSGAPTRA